MNPVTQTLVCEPVVQVDGLQPVAAAQIEILLQEALINRSTPGAVTNFSPQGELALSDQDRERFLREHLSRFKFTTVEAARVELAAFDTDEAVLMGIAAGF